MPALVTSEKPYELAYEASRHAIEDQAGVLDGLQTRAGTLLAATAVVTSFFGAQAFERAAAGTKRVPSLHPISYTAGAIAFFVCVALLTLAVLIPSRRIRFNISAARMFEVIDERADFDPVRAKEAFRVVADEYQRLYNENLGSIRVRLWCSRGATLCLVAEVVLWIVVLGRGKL